jgi:3-hydroxyisobutyrate dehydrogenase
MRVGFIGLGRMGLPMCANLVRAGYELTAGDLRPGRQDAAAACGARWGGTAAEVAITADVLITVLPGTRELHDMMMVMPGGVLAVLPRAATWIDMTSTAPATGRVLARAALASGVGMLDALTSSHCVSASKRGPSPTPAPRSATPRCPPSWT